MLCLSALRFALHMHMSLFWEYCFSLHAFGCTQGPCVQQSMARAVSQRAAKQIPADRRLHGFFICQESGMLRRL